MPSRCGETHRKQNTILAGSRAALPSSTPPAALALAHSRRLKVLARACRNCHRFCACSLPVLSHYHCLASLARRAPRSATAHAAGSHSDSGEDARVQQRALPSAIPLPSSSPAAAANATPRAPAQHRRHTHARATQEHTESESDTSRSSRARQILPQLLSPVRSSSSKSGALKL